jgi:hypothetical protein
MGGTEAAVFGHPSAIPKIIHSLVLVDTFYKVIGILCHDCDLSVVRHTIDMSLILRYREDNIGVGLNALDSGVGATTMKRSVPNIPNSNAASYSHDHMVAPHQGRLEPR